MEYWVHTGYTEVRNAYNKFEGYDHNFATSYQPVNVTGRGKVTNLKSKAYLTIDGVTILDVCTDASYTFERSLTINPTDVYQRKTTIRTNTTDTPVCTYSVNSVCNMFLQLVS